MPAGWRAYPLSRARWPIPYIIEKISDWAHTPGCFRFSFLLARVRIVTRSQPRRHFPNFAHHWTFFLQPRTLQPPGGMRGRFDGGQAPQSNYKKKIQNGRILVMGLCDGVWCVAVALHLPPPSGTVLEATNIGRCLSRRGRAYYQPHETPLLRGCGYRAYERNKLTLQVYMRLDARYLATHPAPHTDKTPACAWVRCHSRMGDTAASQTTPQQVNMSIVKPPGLSSQHPRP